MDSKIGGSFPIAVAGITNMLSFIIPHFLAVITKKLSLNGLAGLIFPVVLANYIGIVSIAVFIIL